MKTFHMDSTQGFNHRGRLGFVYFVSFGNAIKIGCTENPKERMRILKSTHAYHFEVIALLCINPFDMRNIEGCIHDHFRSQHIQNELFDVSPTEVVEYLSDAFELAPWLDKKVEL